MFCDPACPLSVLALRDAPRLPETSLLSLFEPRRPNPDNAADLNSVFLFSSADVALASVLVRA